MKSVVITDLRTAEMREAQAYLAEQGYRFPDVYCETVSADGVRTAVQGFGMVPMADVDENGLGHYHNGNGLAEYREAMRGLREE